MKIRKLDSDWYLKIRLKQMSSILPYRTTESMLIWFISWFRKYDLLTENRDAKAALETHDDFVNDLEEGVKNLKLDHSPSEVRTDELSPDDDAHKTTQHDTEESDLEFGDFVTSAD